MRDDVCFEKENVTAILCSIQQQIVCIDLFLREILWWRWNRVGNRIQEFNNLRIMLKIQFGEQDDFIRYGSLRQLNLTRFRGEGWISRFALLMKQLVLRLSKGKYRLPEILRRRNFRKFYDLQMKLICLNKSTQRRRNRKRGTPLATTRRFPSHRNC